MKKVFSILWMSIFIFLTAMAQNMSGTSLFTQYWIADKKANTVSYDDVYIAYFLDAESTLVGQILVHHEGDFASYGAKQDLKTLVFGLVRVSHRQCEIGWSEKGGNYCRVVGIFVSVGKLCVKGGHTR